MDWTIFTAATSAMVFASAIISANAAVRRAIDSV